jgi:hypothetical protein
MASSIYIPTTLKNTTDAGFRAWGSAISTRLATGGLVKVIATGTVNWTTVTKPATVGEKTGFEIWCLNDALQATAPVFVRIDYGSKTNTGGLSDGVGIWIQAGTTHDGAGTLGGQVTASRYCGVDTVEGTIAGVRAQAFVHSAPSHFCVTVSSADYSAAVYFLFSQFAFGVERAKASDGTDLGTAFVVVAGSVVQVVPASGALPAPEPLWICALSANNPSIFANTVSVAGILPCAGAMYRPLTIFGGQRNLDSSRESVSVVDQYSAAVPYITTGIGYQSSNTLPVFTLQPASQILQRWD